MDVLYAPSIPVYVMPHAAHSAPRQYRRLWSFLARELKDIPMIAGLEVMRAEVVLIAARHIAPCNARQHRAEQGLASTNSAASSTEQYRAEE